MKFYQEKLIFFPAKNIENTPSNVGLEFWKADIITEDGINIFSWVIPARDPKGLIIFSHGNGGNISYYLDRAKFFNSMGYSSILYDYRGYGNSTGSLSENGTYKDLESVIKYAISDMKIPEDNIILWGWSLGGPISAYNAQNFNIKTLVLESTFTSTKDMSDHFYPVFKPFLKYTLRYKYNTMEYLQNIKCPVMIIHSPDDTIIPFIFGRKLYDSIKDNDKNYFFSISLDHNDGFFMNSEKIKNAFTEFISK